MWGLGFTFRLTHPGGIVGRIQPSPPNGTNGKDHLWPEEFQAHYAKPQRPLPSRESALLSSGWWGGLRNVLVTREARGRARGPHSWAAGPLALGHLNYAPVISGKIKKIYHRGGGHRDGSHLSPGRLPALITRPAARGAAGTPSSPGARSGGASAWPPSLPAAGRPRPRPARAPHGPALTLQTAGCGQAEGEEPQGDAAALPPAAGRRPHERAPGGAGRAWAPRAARPGAGLAVRCGRRRPWARLASPPPLAPAGPPGPDADEPVVLWLNQFQGEGKRKRRDREGRERGRRRAGTHSEVNSDKQRAVSFRSHPLYWCWFKIQMDAGWQHGENTSLCLRTYLMAPWARKLLNCLG